MKPVAKQPTRRRAFTIVELLTVMSIIVILIGLLVPALNKVKRYAMKVKQTAQLHSIGTALELFSNEFSGYPPSDAVDELGTPYCGAMKMTEALMGQDLLGFHSNSVFRSDGLDATGTVQLYPPSPSKENMSARQGPYIQAESANAYRLEAIYGANVGSFRPDVFVMCDVYEKQMESGQKTGMPILYYKANTANNLHDPNYEPMPADDAGQIYNYTDNDALVTTLGKPYGATSGHAMASSGTPESDWRRFYRNTRSEKIVTVARPYRPDTFILLSAGWDGDYGTADDIFNFEWKYIE